MEPNKINQILRIAKMHYELNLSQVEIAKNEGISKSTVSRLLKSAMDMGFIEVKIKEPIYSYSELEAHFISKYPLKRIIIVPDIVHNQHVLMRDVCSALIEDLPRYLDNDSIIGVAWGRTLAVLSTLLPTIKRSNIKVIQLNGGFSRAIYESGALNIIKSFVDAVDGEGFLLPAPALVDTAFIADTIKQDSQIRQVLEMAENCDTAVYSVGNVARPSVLYEMGCLTDQEYLDLEMGGATGDVCSHFINKDGAIFDPDLDARVVATPLSVIRNIKNKLLVAVGVEKAPVIAACLKGGLADCLYIDAPTAAEILKLD